MNFNYFDIHSHLNIEPLLENKEAILARMRDEGIGTITVGVDYDTSKLAIELAEANPDMLWATVGMHPTDNDAEEFEYEKYLELAKNLKVVAIGETGLDYFRIKEEDTEIKEKQKKIFEQHIKLAIETNKPLMIHARPSKGSMDAYEDVLDILRSKEKLPHVNFHFFVGDLEIAKQIVSNGWTMSFDGPITFARDYDEVIKSVPIENIMTETDAPFAAPAPHRGKTCEPWMVSEITKKIAEIKDIPPETVQKQLLLNVRRIFDI